MSKHINLSGLKTLLEPLVHLINKKAERPDWNENDASSPSYIEGRTHYISHENLNIFPEKIFIDSNGEFYDFLKNGLIKGESYTVIFDGISYNCIAKETPDGCVYMGNIEFPLMIWGEEFSGTPTDEPFFIWIWTYEDLYGGILAVEGSHTIVVEGKVIHKLSKEYLPRSLITDGYGYNSIVANGLPAQHASGEYSFAEGYHDYNSHSDIDMLSGAHGDCSHAEGYETVAYGVASHSEGSGTFANGDGSHAEGLNNLAMGNYSHAEGIATKAQGEAPHSEGGLTIANGSYSHAEGYNTQANGLSSHAEGEDTQANGDGSHAEGHFTFADSVGSHAEGDRTLALGYGSHAEGDGRWLTIGTIQNLGNSQTAYVSTGIEYLYVGDRITVDKNNTEYPNASVIQSINYETKYITVSKQLTSSNSSKTLYVHGGSSVGLASHTEGIANRAIQDCSHAEGNATIASGMISHTEGQGTFAKSDLQHVQGRYNLPDTTSAHIVGNGTANTVRSNAHTLDWDGNAWYSGDVYVGSTSGINKDEGSKKLATEDYVDEKIETIEIPVDSVNGQTGEVVLTASDIGAMKATDPTGTGSLSVNRLARTNIGSNSCAIGNSTRAQGNSSCAMGYYTQADGDYSFAMGRQAYARGKSSVAFGDNNIAIGNYSYTEGCGLTSGISLTGEANAKVYTYSESPFVESRITEGLFVLYKNSYAQIIQLDKDNRVITLTSSLSSEALNATTVTILLGGASVGISSHVEGECTTAGGDYSHSEGEYTIAGSKGQHVQGRYNITDTSNTHAHIVGNGRSYSLRSNAHTLDWQGNAWYAGDVYVGSTSGTNKDDGSKKLATEEYVDNALSNGSAPDVSGQIEEHNTSSSAHSDIRSSVSNALNEAKSYTDSTLDTAKTYTNTKVAELVNSAPETLDTLGEVAAAIKANETVVDALNSAIGNKVDKVDGKGLSTNDYTTTEKDKLAGIEAGANAYSLPTASASTLGGVKIGTGIGISSGVISNSGVRSISTGSTNGTISVNTNGTSAEVAVKGLGSNAYNSTAYLPLAGGTVTGVTTFSNTTAASSTTTGAVKISGGLGVAGNIYGAKVYGAVWNDYAEYRSQNEKIDAGYIVYCDDDGKLKLTTERLQKFEGVVSDTFGFAIGETEECQTPIAVSGRVLVYCNPEEHFHSGDCVCAGPDGLAYYMTREEIMEYPDRIVGIVSEIPTYETWGFNNIKVNNRIWIRVR